VVILDEAQNCTAGQMKMALTRLGRESKMIVTGDITQIDLPASSDSGLVKARRTLGGIEGVVFIHLGKGDIVRHPVVTEIVHAYAREEENSRAAPGRRLAREARTRDDPQS
jgi:phosphate starvation-inducible PhoH-like protein